MKMFMTVAALAASVASAADAAVASLPGQGQNWVVIAAGSKTYGNYRHQADACHACVLARAL